MPSVPHRLAAQPRFRLDIGEDCPHPRKHHPGKDQGEAQRDDVNYCYVGAWEYKGVGKEPELHKEPLKFDNVHLAIRSYK